MTRLRRVGLLLGLAALVAAGGLAAAWSVPLPERLALPGSSVVRWRDGGTAFLTLSADDRWRVPVDPADVDPAYIEALVRLEDKRFWVHPGVDPLAIARAAVGNLRQGRVVSGASTLTMQVVRLSEPRPRTLRSKLVEAARAVQLELRMSKTEILSAYIDLVPFGGNLEGVEAASHAFFGHGADRLTPAEIATLLAIPQDPTGRAPSPDNRQRLDAARASIARRLLAEGLLERHLQTDGVAAGASGGDRAAAATGSATTLVTADQVLDSIQRTPVPTARLPLPRHAPHAAAWLLGGPAVPGRVVQTSLDRGVQARVEAVVAQASEGLRRRGIDDIAVVVVQHDTGLVSALVGGQDFWSGRHGAQIPTFAVPRSPGSALKPFLYADAIDQGLVLPDQLVLDIPVRYGGYSPANYDGNFDGMVALEDALSRSLNVPFVRLLGSVGVERFLGQLRALGATSLVDRPGHYGLSAVIGGVELTPLELAGMYATLARGGQHLPLRWLQPDAPPPAPVRTMSSGAAWLTTGALSRKDRPDFPARRDLSAVPRHIHWKTGTSFGNRDAWAIGSGARYTVAVWLGNLDRRPSAWLVGADAAGPVLFDLLDALSDGHDRDPRAAWTTPPDLQPVDLCALSGQPPTDACPTVRQGLALRHRVPTATCALHQEVELDVATGLQVGPGCREGRELRREVRVAWPSAVQRWLSTRYREQLPTPDLDPACRLAARGEGPRIASPTAAQVAVLVPGLPASSQEIPFEAESDQDDPLVWFVDGAELARAPAGERVWWTPTPGTHQVLVMDSHGRSSQVQLRVRSDIDGSPDITGNF